MALIRQQRTIVTLDDLAWAFTHAFREVHGSDPETIDIAILFGKLVAECGWPGPGQCCWCWNVGNVRGSAPDGGFTVLAGAYEFAKPENVPAGAIIIPTPASAKTPPGTVCFLPANPDESQRFRAYACLYDALVDYVRVLREHFRDVWNALESMQTTPEQIVAAMVKDHYFSGDAAEYLANMKSGVAFAMRALPAILAPAVQEPGLVLGGTTPASPLGWETRAESDESDKEV